MIQSVVWTVSIALMALVAAFFAWVALSAGTAAEYGPIRTAAYRFRPWLFAGLLAAIVGANYPTLLVLPYAGAAPAGGGAVQRVDAVGEQWSWTLSAEQFIAGRPVEFHVTSKDVNHGFGIYDEARRLVAQTQAMPGYTNVLRYTFTQPGTYQILCLEYCGLVHHNMIAEFKVVAR